MQTTKRSGVAVLLAGAALLGAGCSGSAEEPSGLATSDPPPATSQNPSSEPEPTPTPTSTVPPGLQELRTMELPPGLVIESIPEVKGHELAALDTYVRWEIEYWRALEENEVGDTVKDLAAEDLVADLTDQVESQVDNGFHLGGTLRFDPTVEGATDNTAVVTACFDQSEVTVVRDGSEEIGEDSAKNPAFTATADLSFSGTGWVVTNYRTEMGPC